ncbi:MAG TPA: nuclear transport factor 2 family protein [Vicinamibacteria bacterium]
MLDAVTMLSTLLTLAAVTEATAPGPLPGDRRPADRDAIRAHIEQIFAAYMRRDRAAVRATHAREWRGFIRPSRGIVRGLEQYMREAEPILAGPGRMTAWEITEFDVLFHGDVALVPYVARIEWEEDGVRHPDVLRVLDVYAREDGHWNQVGSQVATHPDALAAAAQRPRTLSASERQELLAAREGVWRAYFAGDVGRLEAVLPEEALAINAGEQPWPGRDAVLAAARAFAREGKLLRLEFPRTEIRAYGDVAVLFTTYAYEVETGGQRQTQAGRGTEVFVRRDGRWVNPGWHLDSGQ